VLGIKTHPTIGSLPEAVDLAVIATPATTVPAIVEECVEAGAKAAVIVSAGFRETGSAGAELERQILERARAGRMRLVGPNCLGVMNPTTGLNATFAARMARPGSVGLVSQSGALLTAVLDWADDEALGFSAVVSLGSMLDVGWADVIDYLGDDPHTKSIVIYMETIGDARSFLSAAREVAVTKPIVVIKAGRNEQAARAAASHTGSLARSDEVLAAAFRRVGVLRVDSVGDLFYVSEVLATQPRPPGRRLTIVTNAGGPRHRHRRPDRGWRRPGRAGLRVDGGPRRRAARGLEPREPDRHPGRRRCRALRGCGRGCSLERRERRAAGHSHAAGDDRSDGDRRASRVLRST